MAEETYFDKISAQIKTGNEPFTWYRNRIRELGTPTVPELLRTGKLNKTPHPKHLNMFVYAPKFARKLPYYDTFPLVLPIESYSDGFLGINLHYLPIPLRIRLLDRLNDFSNNTKFDESTTLDVGVKTCPTSKDKFSRSEIIVLSCDNAIPNKKKAIVVMSVFFIIKFFEI